jgi:hypothetical protein
MGGFGELFGALGEIFGGAAEAAEGGIELAGEAALLAGQGGGDDVVDVEHTRYLAGGPRRLNINDI